MSGHHKKDPPTASETQKDKKMTSSDQAKDDSPTTLKTHDAKNDGFIEDRNGKLSAELNKYSRFQVKGEIPKLCDAVKNLFKSSRPEGEGDAEAVVVVTMKVTGVEIDAEQALDDAGIKQVDKDRTILVMVHQDNDDTDFVTYTSDRVSQTFHVQWKRTSVIKTDKSNGSIEDRKRKLSPELNKNSDKSNGSIEDRKRKPSPELNKNLAKSNGSIEDRNGKLAAELNKYSRFKVKGENPEFCKAMENLIKSSRPEVEGDAEVVVVVTEKVTRVEKDAKQALDDAGIKQVNKDRTILVMVYQANDVVDSLTYTCDMVSQTFHVQWTPTNIHKSVDESVSFTKNPIEWLITLCQRNNSERK